MCENIGNVDFQFSRAEEVIPRAHDPASLRAKNYAVVVPEWGLLYNSWRSVRIFTPTPTYTVVGVHLRGRAGVFQDRQWRRVTVTMYCLARIERKLLGL